MFITNKVCSWLAKVTKIRHLTVLVPIFVLAFFVILLAPQAVGAAAPPAPTIGSPANASVVNSDPQSFIISSRYFYSWSPVFTATSYNIQVSTSPTFTTLLENRPVTGAMGNSYAPSNNVTYTNNTTYYWRVNSVNSAGEISPWSTTWSFTTRVTRPVPPTLLDPANGSVAYYKTGGGIHWINDT